MAYMDTVEKFYREQHPDARVQKWQQEQDTEARAHELVGERLRKGHYVDCRPSAAEADAIGAAYKLRGETPDWTAILRRANERAARACAREYVDELERVKQAAREADD